MPDITDFVEGGKYYIKIHYPNSYDLHVQVLKLKPRSRPDISDYITVKVLESSKDIISECGRNPFTIPVRWVVELDTLSNILDSVMIDDMIYLISEYM